MLRSLTPLTLICAAVLVVSWVATAGADTPPPKGSTIPACSACTRDAALLDSARQWLQALQGARAAAVAEKAALEARKTDLSDALMTTSGEKGDVLKQLSENQHALDDVSARLAQIDARVEEQQTELSRAKAALDACEKRCGTPAGSTTPQQTAVGGADIGTTCKACQDRARRLKDAERRYRNKRFELNYDFNAQATKELREMLSRRTGELLESTGMSQAELNNLKRIASEDARLLEQWEKEQAEADAQLKPLEEAVKRAREALDNCGETQCPSPKKASTWLKIGARISDFNYDKPQQLREAFRDHVTVPGTLFSGSEDASDETVGVGLEVGRRFESRGASHVEAGGAVYLFQGPDFSARETALLGGREGGVLYEIEGGTAYSLELFGRWVSGSGLFLQGTVFYIDLPMDLVTTTTLANVAADGSRSVVDVSTERTGIDDSDTGVGVAVGYKTPNSPWEFQVGARRSKLNDADLTEFLIGAGLRF